MGGITSCSTDLFLRTPYIFLEDGITKSVTVMLYLPRLQKLLFLAGVLWCCLFVCKRLSNLNVAIWSSDLADDSPPEPAPPEVPPRGPSLHHPLQGHATMRGRSGGSINYSLSSGPGDGDNPEESEYVRGASGGNSCVFLSQGREWLQQFGVQ